MRIRRVTLLLVAPVTALLCLAGACQSAAPDVTIADRIVVVSYDGFGGDLAWQFIDSGVATDPDGLASLAENGLAVRRLRMVSPTLTAVNHATLVTGRPPSATGIVSNSYRRTGTAITDTVSGYTASSQAAALWTAARSRRMRVGTLLWPGADAGAVDRMGDFGVVWPGPPLAGSEVLELDPQAAESEPGLQSKDGVTALLWRVDLTLPDADPSMVALEIAVLDRKADGRPRYDTMALRRSDGEWQLVGDRDWIAIRFDARAAADFRSRPHIAWCKALYLDRFGGSLRLYMGAAGRLVAYPDAFEGRLTEAVGPWPGVPDDRRLEEWWLDMGRGIDLDTYLEQVERLDRYLDAVAEWVIANEPFRLLLAYHPTSDEYQHQGLLVNPDQWAYSPGTALAAREGLKRVGRSLDLSVATLWRALDGARDALVVVSDHGQLPITDMIRIHRVLEDAGLVEIDRAGSRPRIGESSSMVATVHGGCAHLYLNLVGREPTGVVKAAEAEEVLRRAARALADLELEGVAAVEAVYSRREAGAVGLNHANTGDLVAFLRPGFTWSESLDGAPVEASRYYGQHGYLAHHDGMAGVLLARGAGIPRESIEEMAATEVAGMVARRLGFEFP